MIAVDSSVWIDYFQGKSNKTVSFLEASLTQGSLVIPPVVLVEVLSFPKLQLEDAHLIKMLPRLDLSNGYWERCSETRNLLFKKGFRCRLGDCLIAQSCIDSHVPLISADRDFKHFVKLGLKLM